MRQLRIAERRYATLDDAYSGRDNAFNFLRLCLAFAVVVAHSRVLGFANLPVIPVDLAGLAVMGFFGLSGFLICRSARRSSLPRYLWHRALRIFPGYWCCLAATAFLFAPVLWLRAHHSVAGFAQTPDGPFGYVWRNASTSVWQPNIDSLLLDTPFGRLVGSVFNGSLWTLKYELLCYLGVALVAVAGVLRRARSLVLLGAVLMYAVMVYDFLHGPRTAGPLADVGYLPSLPVLGQFSKFWVLIFGLAFAAGMLADLYRTVLPLNDVLGGLALGAVAIVNVPKLPLPLMGLALPVYVYALLWLGVRLPRWARAIGRRNDYSYGVYIYAFLVQQGLAVAGVQRIGLFGFTVASGAGALLCAVVSWHLVEKRALRLKDWTPPFVRYSPQQRRRLREIAVDLPPAAHPAPPEPAEPAEVAEAAEPAGQAERPVAIPAEHPVAIPAEHV